MKHKYVSYIPSLAILITDILFFTHTNPNTSATSVLIMGCVLVALTFYAAISKVLGFLNYFNLGIRRTNHFLAAYATVVIVSIIALQSIGDLSLRDILIYIPLAVILYLYLSYGKGKGSPKESNDK